MPTIQVTLTVGAVFEEVVYGELTSPMYESRIVGQIALTGSVQDEVLLRTIRVTEPPPLRLHTQIITPTGRFTRWGADEPNPENIASNLRFSSTMPGGHESSDCILPRKTGHDFPDLQRLSTMRHVGAGGDVAWEGRLERTPQTSGNQMVISPSAVGWSAHLDDDKSVRVVFIDRDLSHWSGPNTQRQLDLLDAGFHPGNGSGGSVEADPVVTLQNSTLGPQGTGLPAGLQLSINTLTAASESIAEMWYYGQGVMLGTVKGSYTTYDKGAGGQNALTGSWVKYINGPLGAAGSGTFDHPLNPPNTNILAQLYYQTAIALEGDWRLLLTGLRVLGDHGLPLHGSDLTEGVLASDVIPYAINKWAPLLKTTADSIQPSSFIIPQLAFTDNTTVRDVITQATRFGLPDFAVWEDKTFYLHDRNARGRKWRARIGPAAFEETGPTMDRSWNAIIVAFNDVDGTTQTVGPPGSGATHTDDRLRDPDPDNPANRLGITRCDVLTMGVSTFEGAIVVGQTFLAQAKLLDRSGRARLVGYATDDRGIKHPAWRVRAGDQVSFIDAADSSPRRIVRADYDHPTRTTSIDLDSPPEGLASLLERLSVSLVSANL